MKLRNTQQRAVSEKRSATYAPTVFIKMPEAKGVTKKQLEAAMDALFRSESIERAVLWKGPDRKEVIGLRETAGDVRDTLQETAETRAGDGAGDTVR